MGWTSGDTSGSEVVVEGRAEGIAEPLGVLNHFVEGLVALLDKGIVLFDLAKIEIIIILSYLRRLINNSNTALSTAQEK